MSIRLLTSLVNASYHTKCVSSGNQKFTTKATLMNLHPDEYNQERHYYPFAVNLDQYVQSCNILNDLSNKVCIPNEIED